MMCSYRRKKPWPHHTHYDATPFGMSVTVARKNASHEQLTHCEQLLQNWPACRTYYWRSQLNNITNVYSNIKKYKKKESNTRTCLNGKNKARNKRNLTVLLTKVCFIISFYFTFFYCIFVCFTLHITWFYLVFSCL